MKTTLNILIWVSVIISWLIILSMQHFDYNINWSLNDDTNYETYLSHELIEYIGYGIMVTYYIGYYDAYKARKRAIYTLLSAILISLMYDFVLGVRVIHPVTRFLESIQWMLNALIFVMAYMHYLKMNKVISDGNEKTV